MPDNPDITRVLDMVVHNPYILKYLQRKETQLSAIVRSGLVGSDDRIRAAVAQSGASGKTVDMPHFNRLAGDDEDMKSSTRLTPGKITSGQDVAVIHRRGRAFGWEDLAAALSGNDPALAIADQIAEYRVQQRQRMLMSTLKGLFAANDANNGGDQTLDITGADGDAAYLSKDSLLYAAQLLGDAKGQLTAVALHSMAETQLNVVAHGSNLYRPASENPALLSTYNGKNLVMDDAMAYDPATGKAELLLFATGAIAFEGAQGNEPVLENYRDALGSSSGIIERDFYIMHPRGTKWKGSLANIETPTHALVQAATSWERVWSLKEMRVVRLIAKIPNVTGGGSSSSSSSGSSASSASSASSGG